MPAPWTTAEDVSNVAPATIDVDDFAPYAQAATDVLYELSARVFAGVELRTVRPVLRGGWLLYQWLEGTSTYVFPPDAYALSTRYGCARRDVALRAPVAGVDQVRIDGAPLDSSEWRLDESEWLVRVAGPDWPAWQDVSLPIGAAGTFEVDYRTGVEPPVLAKLAAQQLAIELAKAASGQPMALPSAVRQVIRTGVTYNRALQASLEQPGATSGLPTVDLFLSTYNPFRVRVLPAAWSPDVQQPSRRTS